MNRGFTLGELLIGLAIVGSIAGLLVTRLAGPLDRAAVRRAVAEFQARHATARTRAVAYGKVTLLRFTPGGTSFRMLSGPDTVDRAEWPGPASHGVSLSGPAGWLRFSPVGIGLGLSNGTWTLTKGAVTRQVIASRSGRLRIR